MTFTLSVIGRRGATPELALIYGSALAGCKSEDEEGAVRIRLVRAVTAVTADVQEAGEAVSVAGTFESRAEVDLEFWIGGGIIERDFGAEVTSGQVLATLDSTEGENGVRAGEAGLGAALGTLSAARIGYDRQRQLNQLQIAACAALERAEQVFTSAQVSADVAAAQLAIAQRRLYDTVRYSDGPGVFTMVGCEPGEVIPAERMGAVFDFAASFVDTVARTSRLLWRSRTTRERTRPGSCVRSPPAPTRRRAPSDCASG